MADFKEFKEFDLANKKEVSIRKINVDHIVEVLEKQGYDNKTVYCIKLSNEDMFYTLTPHP